MMFNCLAILLMYCIVGVAVIFVSSIVVELINGIKRVIKMALDGENPVTIARKIEEANNAGLKAMKNATEFDPIFKRVYKSKSTVLQVMVEILLWPTIWIILVCEYPKAFKKSIENT